MLNPEYVDCDGQNIKIGFSDSDADIVLEIVLTESDAENLEQMLRNQIREQLKKRRN